MRYLKFWTLCFERALYSGVECSPPRPFPLPPLFPILPLVGTARRMDRVEKVVKSCHIFLSFNISEDNRPSGDKESWSSAGIGRTNLKWLHLPTKSFPTKGGRRPLYSLMTAIRNGSKITGIQFHSLSKTKAHHEPT